MQHQESAEKLHDLQVRKDHTYIGVAGKRICHKIHAHEIYSHEINSHKINSHEINFPRRTDLVGVDFVGVDLVGEHPYMFLVGVLHLREAANNKTISLNQLH